MVLALSLASAGQARQDQAPRAGRPLVLGYYVPYDAASWASLQAHADQLDQIGV